MYRTTYSGNVNSNPFFRFMSWKYDCINPCWKLNRIRTNLPVAIRTNRFWAMDQFGKLCRISCYLYHCFGNAVLSM